MRLQNVCIVYLISLGQYIHGHAVLLFRTNFTLYNIGTYFGPTVRQSHAQTPCTQECLGYSGTPLKQTPLGTNILSLIVRCPYNSVASSILPVGMVCVIGLLSTSYLCFQSFLFCMLAGKGKQSLVLATSVKLYRGCGFHCIQLIPQLYYDSAEKFSSHCTKQLIFFLQSCIQSYIRIVISYIIGGKTKQNTKNGT